MRRMQIALSFTLAAAPAAADVSIVDNHKTVTVDCAKDKQVELMGNHITVTLTGTCTKVSMTGNHGVVKGSSTAVYVSGNENTATIDAADDIVVSGNNNTITWKKGASKPQPKITSSGEKNSVKQAK